MNILTSLFNLSDFLRGSIVICAAMIFSLLIISVIANRRILGDFFKDIRPAIWIILLLIFIAAIAIRLNFPGGLYHKLYVDEPWYLEAARNIADNGDQGNYLKSIGWPFLLAVPFLLFGASGNAAFYTVILLGALTSLLLFFIIKKLINNDYLALLAALLLTVNPIHIFWSTSAETNIPSLCFILAALFFWLFYFNNPDLKLFLLSLFSALAAGLFRPENILLIPLLLIGNLLFAGGFFRQNRRKIIVATAAFSLLAVPNALSFLAFFYSTTYLQQGFVVYELEPNEIRTSNWNRLPYIAAWQLTGIFKASSLALSFFALLGLITGFFKRKKIILLLVSWFALFFLFYFASWYPTLTYDENNFFNESRFHLNFYPMILITAILGLEYIIKILRGRDPKITTVFSLALLSFFGLIGAQYFSIFQEMAILNNNRVVLQENKLLTKIAQEIRNDLPADCTIISSETSVLTSINDLKTISAGQVINDRSIIDNFDPQKCLLFFEDKYCLSNKSTVRLRAQKDNCRVILDTYDFQPYKSYSLGRLTYTFYKLTYPR